MSFSKRFCAKSPFKKNGKLSDKEKKEGKTLQLGSNY